jgi:Cysteine-rich CPCC
VLSLGDQLPCPCCGYLTLPDRGIYDICPVCFWEEDGQDDPHADEVWGGPNGSLSLTEARNNYRVLGASDPGRQELVRPPRPEEYPSS